MRAGSLSRPKDTVPKEGSFAHVYAHAHRHIDCQGSYRGGIGVERMHAEVARRSRVPRSRPEIRSGFAGSEAGMGKTKGRQAHFCSAGSMRVEPILVHKGSRIETTSIRRFRRRGVELEVEHAAATAAAVRGGNDVEALGLGHQFSSQINVHGAPPKTHIGSRSVSSMQAKCIDAQNFL